MAVRVNNSTSPHPRRGFTFLEVVVATAMLAVLLATAGQLVVLVKRHARTAEHQATALRTAENCLEEITNRPWGEITEDAVAATLLPASIRRSWPKAALIGSVKTSSEPLEAKQVSIRLTLNPDARAPEVKLTSWVYRVPRR
jgi:prepilin-type N-terminal cleavage/methylation domain-containing protein